MTMLIVLPPIPLAQVELWRGEQRKELAFSCEYDNCNSDSDESFRKAIQDTTCLVSILSMLAIIHQ